MIIRLMLILCAVICFKLCFPDGQFPLLAFACLIPLGLALYRVSARMGLFLGSVYGFLVWFVSVWWLSNSFYFYTGLSKTQSWLWTVIGCMISSLPYGIFGLLCGLFSRTEKSYSPFWRAAALTVLISWYPLLFAGNYVHSLYDCPLAIQLADIGGIPLLLFAVNSINFTATGIIIDLYHKRKPIRGIIALIIIIGFVAGYGALRLYSINSEMTGRTVNIVSVQPNLPIHRNGVFQVFGKDKSVNHHIETPLTLAAEALKKYPQAQLIVLPETPLSMLCDIKHEPFFDLSELARQSGIPFLVNCINYEANSVLHYNCAMMIQSNGEQGQVYRKNILFPFGEYLPFEKELPLMRKIFPNVLSYIPGTDNTPLGLDKEKKIISLLCYEVLFPDLIRNFIKKGGNIMVNMVDDAWFGESNGSAIHTALAVFRAVEFRIPLVRVTNSGNGVFVQPTGEIVQGSRTPLFEKKITSFPLSVPKSKTLYFYTGNLFLWILTGIVICHVLLSLLNRKKQEGGI